ncbi:MAG: hypothetical protein SFU56_11710 [Capsulimonadales bacterium]|nr:hypothetical protein [Capsulimonadales bacterium]
MKVVLKPGGAILMALTLSLLAILAVSRIGTGISPEIPVETAPPPDTPSSEPTETRTVFVNLDAVGGRDWVLWRTPGNPVRKNIARPIIGDLEIVAGQSRPYVTSVRGFSWSGGKPEATGRNVGSGLQVSGVGNGFRFSIPASRDSVRTVRIYVGSFHAGGTFSAKLTDGSEPERIDTAEVIGAGGHTMRLYTVRYRSEKPEGSLQVTWTMGGGNGDGYVTLQAAALE